MFSRIIKILLWCIASFAIGQLLLGCTIYTKGFRQAWDRAYTERQQKTQRLEQIQKDMLSRKFLTIDELVEASSLKEGPIVMIDQPSSVVGKRIPPGTTLISHGPYKEAITFFSLVIEKEYLPFKPMLYLSLEKENYHEAEVIRRQWINCLLMLQSFLKNSDQLIKDKIDIQLNNLNIVGLTDPMLVTLRKELTIALKEKKWDDASKIQNLMTVRVNELKPPPQVVQTPSGQTTIIVPQESSTEHIQVEHLPRYGATDIGRAVSLITRGSSALTPKERGTLGLLDILMKR